MFSLERFVRRFLPIFLLVGGLGVIGVANASSVRWTIPPTALSGNPAYSSVSGTFDWDAINQVVSNVNLSLVVSGTATPINSSSPNNGLFIVMNNASPTVGSPLVTLNAASLTNTATPTTVSSITAGQCYASGGICTGFIGLISEAYNVTLSPSFPPPPNPIPALSVWGQIVMMMLILIATVGRYGWKMR